MPTKQAGMSIVVSGPIIGLVNGSSSTQLSNYTGPALVCAVAAPSGANEQHVIVDAVTSVVAAAGSLYPKDPPVRTTDDSKPVQNVVSTGTPVQNCVHVMFPQITNPHVGAGHGGSTIGWPFVNITGYSLPTQFYNVYKNGNPAPIYLDLKLKIFTEGSNTTPTYPSMMVMAAMAVNPISLATVNPTILFLTGATTTAIESGTFADPCAAQWNNNYAAISFTNAYPAAQDHIEETFFVPSSNSSALNVSNYMLADTTKDISMVISSPVSPASTGCSVNITLVFWNDYTCGLLASNVQAMLSVRM